MTRPFETPLASDHFVFSHGHLLKVAGHDETYEYDFGWEETWMAYMYRKNGYTLYSPHRPVMYKLWKEDYKPDVVEDIQ